MNMDEMAVPFTVVYVIDGDKALLVLHAPDRPYCPNELLGVGGKIEPGETPEQSTMRECSEETGLIIVNQRFRGIFSYQAKNNIGTLYLFTARDFLGTLKDNNEEGVTKGSGAFSIEANLEMGLDTVSMTPFLPFPPY